MRSISPAVLAIAGSFALIGCDSYPKQRAERIAVSSKITFANGQPVRDVLCCFLPHTSMQMPAEFPLDASGNLARTANGVEPKLWPGKYTVYFQPIDRPAAAQYAAAFKLVPEKYTRQGGTGLEVEIDPSGSEFAIRLDP